MQLIEALSFFSTKNTMHTDKHANTQTGRPHTRMHICIHHKHSHVNVGMYVHACMHSSSSALNAIIT